MLVFSAKKGLMLVTRIKGEFVSLMGTMSCEMELFGSYASIEDLDYLKLKRYFRNSAIRW